MVDVTLTEKQYLIVLAVEAYNHKYGQDLNPERCTIQPIRLSYGFDYAFQIETLTGGDSVQIRFYFNVGPSNRIYEVKLESKQNEVVTGALGDEVYVVLGEVYDYDTYRFNDIPAGYTDYRLLNTMTGIPLCFMNGSPIVLVEE